VTVTGTQAGERQKLPWVWRALSIAQPLIGWL
jgi:hypothetical protein